MRERERERERERAKQIVKEREKVSRIHMRTKREKKSGLLNKI